MDFVSPEAEFRDFLANGKFMIQRCRTSGRYVFYPRIAEPGTGDTDLEWVAASGRGTIHSFTVVMQRPPKPAYNVALIDLEEGPRLMSRIVGSNNDALEIGQEVTAEIEPGEEEEPVLVFRPTGSGV